MTCSGTKIERHEEGATSARQCGLLNFKGTHACNLVFVFGTLKDGFPNFSMNTGLRVPGDFQTRLSLPLYLVGERHVPWLLDQSGTGYQVMGQVFEVSPDTLTAMDQLERIHEPDGYRRIQIEVEFLSSDVVMKVHAYLKPASQLTTRMHRMGPLKEYKLEHAALYRRRAD